jgi:hypothetical protein
MFRMISAIGFVFLFLGVVLHFMVFPCQLKVRLSKSQLKAGMLHILSVLIYLGLVASFMGLFITGFGPLLFGDKLHGYVLMFHVTCAPVFIVCASLFVLMNAGKHAFDMNDVDVIKSGCSIKKSQTRMCWLTDTGLGAKSCFWLLAILAVPLTMTVILSMIPLFGTQVQEFLFDIHRWTALFFALIMFIELYMLLRMNNLKESKK